MKDHECYWCGEPLVNTDEDFCKACMKFERDKVAAHVKAWEPLKGVL